MKLRFLFSGLIILSAVIFCVFWFYPPLRYNMHMVIPNQVYRSAQLPAKTLRSVIKRWHIRSIVNLRNAHPGEQWWINEAKISKQHHIHLYNLALPAHGLPTVQQLRVLTRVLAHAKRPMLIHCRHGDDRSGLASAITLILRNDPSYSNIYQQVSWCYWVLDWDSVGKLLLPYYQKWLATHHASSSAAAYYEWLKEKRPF